MTKALLGLVFFSVFTGIICARRETVIQATTKFIISTESRSFIGAWLACKTEGLELASVQSYDEQQALNATIADATNESLDGYWIGGVAETEGSSKFYWVDSALRISYTNWGSNQPRYSGSDFRKECIRLGNFYKTNEPYKWENADCAFELPYICKLNS